MVAEQSSKKQDLERENLLFHQKLLTRGAVEGDGVDDSAAEEVEGSMTLDQGTTSRGKFPLMSKVSLKLKEKNWAFQFVDLVDLLPDSTNPAPSPIFLFRDSEEDIVFDTKPKEKRITSVLLWLQAFGSYSAILMVKFPNCAPELFHYMLDIINLSNQHNWELVSAYDTNFHLEVQENLTKNWSLLDNIIFAREIISPAMSMVRSRASLTSPQKQKPQEVCKKFNSG